MSKIYKIPIILKDTKPANLDDGAVKRLIKELTDRGYNLKVIKRFRYNNQDHALTMGILAARGIVEEKQYNIEDVGAEQEYFEKGYVRK